MDKQYNKFLRQHIILNEGEHFCPKCHGKGKIPKFPKTFGVSTMLVCDKCRGDGKIDWVENVVGKKRVIVYGYEHSM